MIDLVTGRRQQGKTTLAYYVAKKKTTVVIFDPRRLFHTTDDTYKDASHLYELLNDRAEIIIQPDGPVPESFREVTRDVLDWVEENPEEEISFLVDECYFVDTSNEEYEDFDRLLRFSNRDLVELILTCHRPKDISVNIRSIADRWFMFHTTQEHDLKVIEERCGEKVSNQVRQLKKYQFVLWDDGVGKEKVITDSAFWNVSLERPVEEEGIKIA